MCLVVDKITLHNFLFKVKSGEPTDYGDELQELAIGAYRSLADQHKKRHREWQTAIPDVGQLL